MSFGATGLVESRERSTGTALWRRSVTELFDPAACGGTRVLEGMRRRIVVLLLVAGVLGSPAIYAAGGVVAEIPIEVERGKTIVPVTMGGVTLRLILDTGLPYDGILVFHREKVDTEAGTWSRSAVSGAGPGGGVPTLTNESGSFAVGPVALANQRIIVLDSDIYKGFPTDGVIGYSLLGHYAVRIDFDAKAMTLYDPQTFSPEAGWDSLPIYFKDNRIPWIDLDVATADEPPARLSAYIDSASRETLELLRRDANRFTLPATTTKRHLGRGLSGDIYGEEGTIARVRIGDHELESVRVAIALASTRSRQRDADAIVGNGVLSRFHVVFDYAGERLHIRPNAHFGDPF